MSNLVVNSLNGDDVKLTQLSSLAVYAHHTNTITKSFNITGITDLAIGGFSVHFPEDLINPLIIAESASFAPYTTITGAAVDYISFKTKTVAGVTADSNYITVGTFGGKS